MLECHNKQMYIHNNKLKKVFIVSIDALLKLFSIYIACNQKVVVMRNSPELSTRTIFSDKKLSCLFSRPICSEQTLLHVADR